MKAICYVLDDNTVNCIVCHCTRESSCLLCFIMGGITAAAVSFELWVFCTKCHTSHSQRYRVFLITHIVCLQTTTVYAFYGITNHVGCAILECGFQALPGQRVRLHLHLLSTVQNAKDLQVILVLYTTLCACVSSCNL